MKRKLHYFIVAFVTAFFVVNVSQAHMSENVRDDVQTIADANGSSAAASLSIHVPSQRTLPEKPVLATRSCPIDPDEWVGSAYVDRINAAGTWAFSTFDAEIEILEESEWPEDIVGENYAGFLLKKFFLDDEDDDLWDGVTESVMMFFIHHDTYEVVIPDQDIGVTWDLGTALGEGEQFYEIILEFANVLEFDSCTGVLVFEADMVIGDSGYWFNVHTFTVIPEHFQTDPTYTVSFNVDMSTSALFDPEVHTVFLTGTITGWAEPGDEGSIVMVPGDGPVDDDDAVVFFYETFGDGLPDGWENNIISGPDGFPGWEHTLTGGAFNGQLASTTADDGYMILDSDAHGVVGSPEEVDLITSSIDLSEAHSNVIFSLEHLARTFGAAEIYINISVDDFETYEELYSWAGGDQHSYNTEDGAAPSPNVVHSEFNITEIAAGESNVKIMFKWIGEYDYWWLIDDVKITADDPDADKNGNGLWYTAEVHDIEAGEIQYKYFSDAHGEGWEGGEWTGDPNRVVEITGDTELWDIFHGPFVSILEPETDLHVISLFPNPVSNTLYVENNAVINQIRVYDLTGRMVYSRMINSNAASVDVSQLNQGIYVIQVVTENGISAERFNVVK